MRTLEFFTILLLLASCNGSSSRSKKTNEERMMELEERLSKYESLEDGISRSERNIKEKNQLFEKNNPKDITAAYLAAPWDEVNSLCDSTVDFLLREANAMCMASAGDGQDWLVYKDGLAINMGPLTKHPHKDDYDTPTQFFVGPDPHEPLARGKELRNRMHQLRDGLTGVVKATAHNTGVDASAILQSISEGLTVPETVETIENGKPTALPWTTACFYHTPVVAANALIRALVADMRKVQYEVLHWLYQQMGESTDLPNE